MQQCFSTELLPAAERPAAWKSIVHKTCGDGRMQFSQDPPFTASLNIQTLADIEIRRIFANEYATVWCRRGITYWDDSYCFVTTQLKGMRHISQNDTTVRLTPGDTLLIDLGKPWSSVCFGAGSVRLTMPMARRMIENRLSARSLPIAKLISGKNPLGTMLSRIALMMYRDAELLTSEEGFVALDTYLNILSGGLGIREENVDGEDRFQDLSARIRSFIEVHLTEPQLGPSDIASALGISVRHAHRVLALNGHTIRGLIRDRRLEMCRRDLNSPLFRDRSITEIAFSWGFNDSAHFSRSFKKKFGSCPRTFRESAWQDSRTFAS